MIELNENDHLFPAQFKPDLKTLRVVARDRFGNEFIKEVTI